MQSILALVIFLAIGFFFLSLFVAFERRQLQLKTENHIVVEMIRTNDVKDTILCPLVGNEVLVHKKAGKINKGKSDMPEGGIPRYFTDHDSNCFVWYPYKKGIMRWLMSVVMPCVTYFEGCPEPITKRRKWTYLTKEIIKRDENDIIIDLDFEKSIELVDSSKVNSEIVWDEQKIIATPTMLGLLRDERFAMFASHRDDEVQKLQNKLTAALGTRIKPMIVYIALAVSIIAMLISIYYSYNLQNQLSKIADGVGVSL